MLVQFTDRAQRPDFSDFKVYWTAGAKAALHHTVYDVEGHYQFKYSPFVALLWSAPHLLGGPRYLWAAAHYAACAGGFLLLWYLCARLLDRERSLWLWLLTLLTFSVGLRDELKLGQANLWPLLLVLPTWMSGARKHPAGKLDIAGLAIGAAWAFAIQWKLYALVFGPVWLLRKRAGVFIGAILFTAASLWGALSLAHGSDFAAQENARWISSLTASSQELLVSQYNVSALGVFGKWGAHAGLALGPWAYVLWLALALAWGWVLLWAELAAQAKADESRTSPYLVFWSASWAWAGIVVLNPLVWPYWLNFCVPLYLAYVHRGTRALGAWPKPGLMAVAGFFMLANWLQNTELVHEGASFIAVCALLFDAQRRIRRPNVEPYPHLSTLRPSCVETSRSS